MSFGCGAYQVGYKAGGGDGRATGVTGTRVVVNGGACTSPTYVTRRGIVGGRYNQGSRQYQRTRFQSDSSPCREKSRGTEPTGGNNAEALAGAVWTAEVEIDVTVLAGVELTESVADDAVDPLGLDSVRVGPTDDSVPAKALNTDKGNTRANPVMPIVRDIR